MRFQVKLENIQLEKLEDKQYYTPDIEDLFVGYECEIKTNHGFESFDNNKEKWVPIKIGYLDVDGAYTDALATIINEFDDGATPVRTPYLSKEQIESEKWIFEAGIGNNIKRYSKSGYIMSYNTDDYELIIMDRNSWSIFKGKCPSINELRKIQKLLNIKLI